MIKLIIFDYDGVIVDSFSNTYEAYKVIAKKLNKSIPDTIEEFRRIYGYNYIECHKNLGITKKEENAIEGVYRKEILKRNLAMFEGIDEVLKKLSQKYKLVLISATFRDEVMQKLDSFGITKYFGDIKGKYLQDTIRLSKHEKFMRMMKKYNVSAEETLIIGDRNIDYDEAMKAGIKNIILVEYGWGYNRDRLEGLRPDIFVHKPKDILKAVEILDK